MEKTACKNKKKFYFFVGLFWISGMVAIAAIVWAFLKDDAETATSKSFIWSEKKEKMRREIEEFINKEENAIWKKFYNYTGSKDINVLFSKHHGSEADSFVFRILEKHKKSDVEDEKDENLDDGLMSQKECGSYYHDVLSFYSLDSTKDLLTFQVKSEKSKLVVKMIIDLLDEFFLSANNENDKKEISDLLFLCSRYSIKISKIIHGKCLDSNDCGLISSFREDCLKHHEVNIRRSEYSSIINLLETEFYQQIFNNKNKSLSMKEMMFFLLIRLYQFCEKETILKP
ncbi:hypothetical protein EDEG_00617 [Edhazardia aedis USNM 41457]|uniref:Uncharacterized protein n=1 Tax=Edhazardia aedis (strain USNM 41457) TaxID=1003232 RepID=J9DCW7_EDHAE|nr:hypothetical protein EDEG_00617 [Edhazardia aedis USNM 41457]|eukprot:EJW05314.1 hypothetical protein EDEG_00617 [Edhazardia aedis USNM 41457]